MSLHKPFPTEEPDGGNLLVRIWRGPRLENWPGLPYNLVRFARGGGTRDATRRKSSSPVKMELSPPHDENDRTAKLTARLLLEVLSARG